MTFAGQPALPGPLLGQRLGPLARSFVAGHRHRDRLGGSAPGSQVRAFSLD